MDELLCSLEIKTPERQKVAARFRKMAFDLFGIYANDMMNASKGKLHVFEPDSVFKPEYSMVRFDDEDKTIRDINLQEGLDQYTMAHELGHLYHCYFYPEVSANIEIEAAESVAIFTEMYYAMRYEKTLDKWAEARFRPAFEHGAAGFCGVAHCIYTWPDLDKVNVHDTIERIIAEEGIDPVLDRGGLQTWGTPYQILQ